MMGGDNMSESVEVNSPLDRLFELADGDIAAFSDYISAALEFLTIRAVIDSPYVIYTDNRQAMAVFAANDDVDALSSILPENFKNWEELISADLMEMDDIDATAKIDDITHDDANAIAEAMNEHPEQEEFEEAAE